MNFGQAINALKDGMRMTRKGWNGKNQYIELATCISYMTLSGEIVNVEHKNIGSNAIAFVGTSGVQMGWLASQADMLANDWEVFEEPVDEITEDSISVVKGDHSSITIGIKNDPDTIEAKTETFKANSNDIQDIELDDLKMVDAESLHLSAVEI